VNCFLLCDYGCEQEKGEEEEATKMMMMMAALLSLRFGFI
jgi:hypothetical protein